MQAFTVVVVPHNSVSEVSEEGEEWVGGAVAAGFEVARPGPVECFLFDGHVAVEVDAVGGAGLFMSEP